MTSTARVPRPGSNVDPQERFRRGATAAPSWCALDPSPSISASQRSRLQDCPSLTGRSSSWLCVWCSDWTDSGPSTARIAAVPVRGEGGFCPGGHHCADPVSLSLSSVSLVCLSRMAVQSIVGAILSSTRRVYVTYISYLCLYTYIIYIDAMIVCARNGVGRIRPHHRKWVGRERERGRLRQRQSVRHTQREEDMAEPRPLRSPDRSR
ncbi:uncharacterized protein K489DRAFT_86726 [Dissoconium aciculare CBS 342.82]|uniref:Uncharacterized protein n=1 Tax=Dissoconium aciculare CBS 342.82 TaxID=1314786 RepID=A0A6J3LTC9_9PEZI|nr:uncharacterized protein K489DRAFT_86726 [Dissoconium aciculare CBS 342.82]KAF1819035.1 hypothetical protein K489DRAFT_86726 [Dissoconium aciculare CBS 342.82]